MPCHRILASSQHSCRRSDCDETLEVRMCSPPPNSILFQCSVNTCGHGDCFIPLSSCAYTKPLRKCCQGQKKRSSLPNLFPKISRRRDERVHLCTPTLTDHKSSHQLYSSLCKSSPRPQGAQARVKCRGRYTIRRLGAMLCAAEARRKGHKL